MQRADQTSGIRLQTSEIRDQHRYTGLVSGTISWYLMGVRDYQRLTVWQTADALIPMVYSVARQLPNDERFGLASQLKRAAVSIASNIAEGSGRSADADFERFLSIAAGSASEVEYQLGLVTRMWPSTLGIDGARHHVNQVKRMLWSLMEASKQERSTRRPATEI